MTDYEKILHMIENVSPDDTATLDEIDARVWCWLEGKDPDELYEYSDGKKPAWRDNWFINEPSLSRSRDALKSIRPDGWVFTIDSRGWCRIWNTKNCNAPKIAAQNNKIGHLPTEELAELHAIIQAIQWERENEYK